MKKYNFCDKMYLTDRFLEGKISIVVDAAIDATGKESVKRDGQYFEFSDGERIHCRYKEGESIVVMTSYEKAGMDKKIWGDSTGWRRKICADPKYLPTRMVIEEVRCVRVQDLTEKEVLKAGVQQNPAGLYFVGGDVGGFEKDWRFMYSRVFNRIFKCPYQLNPWVVVYRVTPVLGRV